jgi:hypothetical protein
LAQQKIKSFINPESHRETGLSSKKHSILIRKYLTATGKVDMAQPENDDELSEEQEKKEAYSFIIVLIAVIAIGISFVWHMWSALFPETTP